MPTDCLMPLASSSRPKTRPDGTPYTVDDKEYWLLEKDGGIRRHQHFSYPAMRYRAVDDGTGRVKLDERTVVSEREDAEAQGSGWYRSPADAKGAKEAAENAIAQAAAEVAAAATRMTEKAQREYRKRSAESPEHITE